MTGTSADLFREQFKIMHEWLSGTVADLSDEQANWQPLGSALPAGAQYLHHLNGEDFYINRIFRQREMLAESDFAGKTGGSDLPPMGVWREWATMVHVDMASARSYGQAVAASTDAFLAGLSDDELAAEQDLTSLGWGTFPMSYVLNQLIVDGSAHCGEISCLKGLQGAQGYPF